MSAIMSSPPSSALNSVEPKVGGGLRTKTTCQMSSENHLTEYSANVVFNDRRQNEKEEASSLSFLQS